MRIRGIQMCATPVEKKHVSRTVTLHCSKEIEKRSLTARPESSF